MTNPYMNINYLPQLNAKFKATDYSSALAPKQAAGTNFNPYSALANGMVSAGLGGVGLVADFINMGNEAKNINTKAPELQIDPSGNPTYNLGSFLQETRAIKPQGASAGEVLGSSLKGASAGAALGPLGAAGGALVGAIGSLFGGRRRRRIMEDKKRTALKRFKSAQADFNSAAETSDANRKAYASYQEQMNTQDRLNNLFNIQPNLGI